MRNLMTSSHGRSFFRTSMFRGKVRRLTGIAEITADCRILRLWNCDVHVQYDQHRTGRRLSQGSTDGFGAADVRAAGPSRLRDARGQFLLTEAGFKHLVGSFVPFQALKHIIAPQSGEIGRYSGLSGTGPSFCDCR